ncbi:MAG TPA: hypothetical protein GX743_07330 [Actinomycetales bacterium]|nr:hypothetical protein [Actinomycetales bacterium]
MATLPPSPRSIRAVAAITVFQVLAVTVLAFVELIRPEGAFEDPGLHIFWLLVLLIAVFASWHLMKGRPWARSILVTWHLLLAMSFIASFRIIGLASSLGLIASVAAIVLLTVPTSRDFIVDRRSELLDDVDG